MLALAQGCRATSTPFVVVADRKSPATLDLPGATYFTLEEQRRRYPALSDLLPVDNYARKNFGYLAAMDLGVEEIQETDDDNCPLPGFWHPVVRPIDVDVVESSEHWFNAYSLFTSERIWPRGFPLEFVQRGADGIGISAGRNNGWILTGLADGDPDVDAVYRMTCELPIVFRLRRPIALAPGTWCPFNSQNTITRREAFALLYMPVMCSIRMTDIWRSFVAQRCLWEAGETVVFHSASVRQDRNEHNLLRDFELEIPGYLHNDTIRRLLDETRLDARDMTRNLVLCYEVISNQGFLPREEIPVVRIWCQEIDRLS